MPQGSPPPGADFETVCAALTPWLMTAARRRLRPLAPRDLEDAAHDVVQATWVSVWHAWETVEQTDARRRDNYCMTALLHKLMDLERARRRWAKYGGAPLTLSGNPTLTPDESDPLDVADARADTSAVVDGADLSLILRRFRVRLAAKGEKAWKLHYVRLLQQGTEPQAATRIVHGEMSLYRGRHPVHTKTAAARTAQLRAELASFIRERNQERSADNAAQSS